MEFSYHLTAGRVDAHTGSVVKFKGFFQQAFNNVTLKKLESRLGFKEERIGLWIFSWTPPARRLADMDL